MLPYEFCKIFKNSFLAKHFQAIASVSIPSTSLSVITTFYEVFSLCSIENVIFLEIKLEKSVSLIPPTVLFYILFHSSEVKLVNKVLDVNQIARK